jgi:hypothetical protein
MAKPTLTRPKDKSFASFKKWMDELATALKAERTLTDEELKKAWVKFWKGK